MINKFCKKPLWECNETLVKVALGQRPADLVITDARLVDVCTHEILEHASIAVAEGRIAYVGFDGNTADHCIGDATVVIDAAGSYVAPAFMDGHMHVESAMVGVGEYARAVIPHGTCGIYMDPHEVANVVGLKGVSVMMEDARRVPLKAMLTTPSCVPAVPGFEDTGSAIDATDVAESMKWDSTVALGEMMNFPGVLACDPNTIGEIDATLRADKAVTGHYSVPERDRGLNAYIASGVSSCHESLSAADVTAKLRLGMYAQLREGSAWNNLEELAPAIVGKDIDTRFCCLVSDDNHPHTIVGDGHLDRILRKAVRYGIDPVTAIQMVTINTATSFHMEHDMGSITPGKCADIVFLDDLTDFRASRVIIDGDVVAEHGRITFELEPFDYPSWMTDTMNVGMDFAESTFGIPAVDGKGASLPGDTAQVTVRCIGVNPGKTITGELEATVPVKDGMLLANPDNDVLKVFVFERHHATGSHAAGFVKGFGIHGALAQTVAHDAHNLLVMGDNDADMALAAQALTASGGGEVAVADGQILAIVPLPVCGLMSDAKVDEVSEQVSAIEEAWETMGCTMPSPFMTMGGLSLACIPELRLTNRGYVNCLTFEFEPIVVE